MRLLAKNQFKGKFQRFKGKSSLQFKGDSTRSPEASGFPEVKCFIEERKSHDIKCRNFNVDSVCEKPGFTNSRVIGYKKNGLYMKYIKVAFFESKTIRVYGTPHPVSGIRINN